MIQYPEEVLKKASEELGSPVSNEEFFKLRAEAVAYFRYRGREHTEKVLGHTEIGRRNIRMIFGQEA